MDLTLLFETAEDFERFANWFYDTYSHCTRDAELFTLDNHGRINVKGHWVGWRGRKPTGADRLNRGAVLELTGLVPAFESMLTRYCREYNGRPI